MIKTKHAIPQASADADFETHQTRAKTLKLAKTIGFGAYLLSFIRLHS